jgi:cysteine-rich repeat protein
MKKRAAKAIEPSFAGCPGRRLTWLAVLALACGGLGAPGCSDDGGGQAPTDASVDAAPPEASMPVCGDGVVEGDEECDDGNVENGDGCDEFCVIEYECGNGVVEFDEPCDGTDLTSNCVWEGHLSGQMLCTEECTLDASDCVDTDENLVAWYKLDSVAALVPDNTGNGHGCIPHELTSGFPGPIGESTLFEELAGSYAECGTGDATSPLDGFSGMTVEAWIKLNSYAGIEDDMRVVISRNLTTDATDLIYVLGVAGSAFSPQNYHAMFAVGSLAQQDIAFTADPLLTGDWYHLAGVYQDGELSIYLNGVLSGGVTLDASGPLPSEPDARTYLGGIYVSGQQEPEQWFDGFVDDVKLWSVARSPEEVCRDSGGFYDPQGDPACTHPEM